MKTTFEKQNDGWNAEPNAPDPKANFEGKDLILTFHMKAFQFPDYDEDDIGQLRFTNCKKYRLGSVNDEGWYRGQCRFSRLAPEWGEFYLVSGDLKLDEIKNDWVENSIEDPGRHHYLFYFRDEEFECEASEWELKIIKHNKTAYTTAASRRV